MLDQFSFICTGCWLESYWSGDILERDLVALLRRRCDVCGAPLRETLRRPDGLVVPGDEAPRGDGG
jgi:hypothetical protein